jgi:hypothetical protein
MGIVFIVSKLFVGFHELGFNANGRDSGMAWPEQQVGLYWGIITAAYPGYLQAT